MKNSILVIAALITFTACAQKSKAEKATPENQISSIEKIEKSEAEWKKILTADQYFILREKGTERAFTSDLLKNKEVGTYVCAACELPLFASKTKFKSGTGWPSFYEPISKVNVAEESDRAYGMVRTEILCARCDGHLGHVFPDGPKPSGLRYCINGDALKFDKKD